MPFSNENERAKISWDVLPVEIQHHICAHLCAYARGNQKALAALCRTSSSIRAIVQPMLYRHVTCCDKEYNLIQTLSSRPDLATSVRRYTQWSYICNSSYIRNDQSSKFGDLARELLMDEPDDAKFGEHSWPGSFINDLVLALMPNIEMASLIVQQNHNAMESTFEHLARRSERLNKAPIFSNLRHLEFNTEAEEHWGYEMSIMGIQVLLGLAPDLRQLVFNHATGFVEETFAERGESMDNYPKLPSLESLEFIDSAFDADVDEEFNLIRHIFKTSPCLKHFRFKSQGVWIGEDVSMESMGTALIRCLNARKDTIESLDLDLTQHSNGRRGNGYVADDLRRHPLAGFTQLAYLKVDEGFICPKRQCQPDSNLEWPCMRHAIPQSIETLLVRVFEESRAWIAFSELAMNVKAGLFPKLKELVVHAINRKIQGSPKNAVERRRQFSSQIEKKGNELRQSFRGLVVKIRVEERGYFG